MSDDVPPADRLVISFRALERAQHTIEDFVQTYFPLHGLDSLKDFLAWWHLLVYVEGAIYQADEDNEQAAGSGAEQPGSAGLEAVQAVLRERGLLTPGVQHELEAGQQYWAEERRLCSLMQAHPTVPPQGHPAGSCGFGLAEVLATSEAKSFDYRLLHHLVYALREAEPEAALLAFLRVDELLVDVGDDFLDYEDDITAGGGGSFNLLRCYVHLYGRQAPVQLAARIGDLEGARDALLAGLPQEQQRHVRRREVEAAEEEGEGALRWQVPPLVLDEAAFRKQFG